jgi:hypothetical protein
MDWAIVVTGAVGLAGIGGTLLSARMTSKSDAANLRASISAEDTRAKLAEKRRIYASCIAALDAYANYAEYATRADTLPLAQRAQLLGESARSRLAAFYASSEMDLIAPPEVAVWVHRMLWTVLRAEKAATNEAQVGEIVDAHMNVVVAMRRDLGEHAPLPERTVDDTVSRQADPESAPPADVANGTQS